MRRSCGCEGWFPPERMRRGSGSGRGETVRRRVEFVLMIVVDVVAVLMVVSLRGNRRSVTIHCRTVPIHHLHLIIPYRNNRQIIGGSVFVGEQKWQHHPCCPCSVPALSSSISTCIVSSDHGRTGEVDVGILAVKIVVMVAAVVVVARLATRGLIHLRSCGR